jgi:hypothetical protein
MSDAAFVEEVLRSLEALDTACLDFLAADKTIPRDLQLVAHLFRRVNACKAALLHHDLVRLDALAGHVLASPPGDWSIRFREDVAGQTTDVEALVRRIRHRHHPLIHLAGLLDGAVESKRRGRPRDTDPKADQRVFDAWRGPTTRENAASPSFARSPKAHQRTALKAVRDFAAVLGLDPSSRSRLRVQPADVDDPLAKFLDGE